MGRWGEFSGDLVMSKINSPYACVVNSSVWKNWITYDAKYDNCFDWEVRRFSQNSENIVAYLCGIREDFSEEVTFLMRPKGQVRISVKNRETFTWETWASIFCKPLLFERLYNMHTNLYHNEYFLCTRVATSLSSWHDLPLLWAGGQSHWTGKCLEELWAPG